MGAGRCKAVLATLVLCLGALPLAALLTSAPAAAAAPAGKVLPLGDSITLGVGDGRSCVGGPNGSTCKIGGYRPRLANELKNHAHTFDFIGTKRSGPDSLTDKDHEGNSGFLIGQLYSPWDANKSKNPDIVLLMAGTNDIYSGQAANAPQRLGFLIDRILQTASVKHVIVAKIPPFVNSTKCAEKPNAGQLDPQVQNFNNTIPGVVAARGSRASWVDMYSIISKSTDMADCVHPDQSGYEKIGTAWYNKIASRLTASPTVPGAPTNVSATPGDARATVSFTPPSNNGGSPITGYAVTSSPATTTKLAAGSPMVFDGLTNGVAYRFTVRAANSVGLGPGATSNSVTPTATPPPPPPSGTTYLSDLTASKTGTGTYQRDRNANDTTPLNAGAQTYQKGLGVNPAVTLTYALNGNFSRFLSDVGIGRTLCGSGGSATFRVFLDSASTAAFDSGTMSGNTAIKKVDIDVTGKSTLKLVYEKTGTSTCNYGAWGDARLTTSSTPPPSPTAPGAPTIGAATAGNGQATVSFTPPAYNGGSTIIDYTVTGVPGGSQTGTSSPITVTGLTNDTSYTFTVTARNSVGTSSPSAASNPVTPTEPPPPGDETFLSDLTATKTGTGTYQRDRNGNNTGLIRLGSVQYAKGLGVNPPVTLTYALGGNYKRFLSDVGIDEICGNAGSARFRVFRDSESTPAFDSGATTGASATKQIDVDVTGTTTLKLVYERTGVVSCDYGAWADARLTK